MLASFATFAIVLGCAAAVALVPLAVLWACRMHRKRYDSTMATVPSKPGPKRHDDAPTNLMPPVFLTEGMSDPLLQEDLHETVPRSACVGKYV
jgi:hypothetical protein